MGAIKEHYHDKIQADYNQMNTTDAAKMAIAETLKEVIDLLRSEIGHGEWTPEAEYALNYYAEKLEQKIKDSGKRAN